MAGAAEVSLNLGKIHRWPEEDAAFLMSIVLGRRHSSASSPDAAEAAPPWGCPCRQHESAARRRRFLRSYPFCCDEEKKGRMKATVADRTRRWIQEKRELYFWKAKKKKKKRKCDVGEEGGSAAMKRRRRFPSDEFSADYDDSGPSARSNFLGL